MCKQLGFACTALESDGKDVQQIDGEHEQFNKLVSSMKRMTVKNGYRAMGAGDFAAVSASATRGRSVY